MQEFDQSRQRLVLRRDEVDLLEYGVVVGVFGHEPVFPAYNGRHGAQKTGTNKLKPFRDLGLARLLTNWLVGALVNLADVVHGQRVGEIDSRFVNIPGGLYSALARIS